MKLVTLNCWHSPLLLLFPSQTIVLEQKNLKLHIYSAESCTGQGEANKFHVIPLASTWGMAVEFNVLFLV